MQLICEVANNVPIFDNVMYTMCISVGILELLSIYFFSSI